MKSTALFLGFFFWLLLLASTSPCFGQITPSADNNKADKIHELVSAYAAYGKFNGAILVAEKGEILYKKGFGFANMEWNIPNETDTRFRLASVSKQFSAMLIMQLVGENKLALDLPISTYLPEYPKEKADKITIHHLLTHTSGTPSYTSFPNYQELMLKSMQPDELLQVFADSTLLFEPGERFSYSNSGYALLGAILEKITKKSYKEVLQEKILNPLGMTHTGFENSNAIIKNRAMGYYKMGSKFTPANYIDMSIAYAAGGLYSSVEDMYRWDQALYTEKLLPQKYLDLIFSKHIAAWGQHYGYGWLVGDSYIGNTKKIIQTIEHDGVINGFNSLIFRIPSERSSIILLNNTGGALLYEMSQAISGILYDKSYDFPKKSIAYDLLKTIKQEGIAVGLSFYESIKDDDDYNLDEREMNDAAYEFLQANELEKGIAILKLNLAAFPNAFNVYDSYGEALMMLGDTTNAIKKYKKSITLNPKNENGIEMLKKLGVEIDRTSLYLLKTEGNWKKEIFTFPLKFAPAIAYKGIEEAHFPNGWRNIDSPEFWSYTFAWNINLDRELSVAELETNLQSYFDGLAKVVNKNKDFVPPSSIAKIYKKDDNNGVPTFAGTIKIFDAFVTNEPMELKVWVEKHFCEEKKQSILVFKFSPKDFEHEIWRTLDAIKLRENKCEK